MAAQPVVFRNCMPSSVWSRRAAAAAGPQLFAGLTPAMGAAAGGAVPGEVALPDRVRIVEVGARDGLQNERRVVPAEDRARLVSMLVERCGLRTVEVGSFVSEKWVPQMAGSGDVLRSVRSALARSSGAPPRWAGGYNSLRLPVLTPNMKGFQMAVDAGAEEVAVFAAASEGFSRRNINCSVDESLRRYRDVCDAAREAGTAVRGYVSTVAGCPFDGVVHPGDVARVAAELLEMGCYEVSLGDTIGVGTPNTIDAMIAAVLEAGCPPEQLAVHFHDTYGMAVANIMVALRHNISVIDSAVAGLGGCPYAPGAGGNVATEDVVYLMDGLGIDTGGVRLDELVSAGDFICGILGKQTDSRVGRARAAVRAKAAARQQQQSR